MTRDSLSRRRFLQTTAVGAAGFTAGSGALPSRAVDDPPKLIEIGKHLAVYHGPINVGIVRDGEKGLLIDCGDGSVASALPKIGISSVESILFTHHHRDQACGAHELVADGARLTVPADERQHFDDVDTYWANPKSRWHIYNQHPHHLMLAESVTVDATCDDGDVITFGPAKIRVIATPGHTDGAISLVVEVDGKRVIFCGDAIYDEGRVWELFSLQKGIQTSDYHGFLGAREELTESLGRIKQARPDRLVPSHGQIMIEPARAIDALVARLAACYDKYVAISALRHYFPKMFTAYEGRQDHMPIRPGKPVPDCLRHFGTTWMLLSQDKSAFVMDCGNRRVVEQIRGLVEQGEVGRVEGLWVTHYHDDHVDAIPEFQKTFDCPCYTDRHVARVITNPLAWRLPCISPSKARVDRPTDNEQSWTWHEFRLTAYHFPGQTLYHAGLFVEGLGAEGKGLRMLFVGDSFTMGGIDDYCAHNRNWLGRGVGFDRCIALIEKLRPTHVFNCHVNQAFDFTAEQCRFMRANLAEREKLFGQLVPWNHANYGMDEPWIRTFPYEQRAKPGDAASLRVVVTNHSDGPRDVACRAVLPGAWSSAADSPGNATDWGRTSIPAKSEAHVALRLSIPEGVRPGRYVIPIDVQYGGRTLPQWTEAIVVV